MKSFIQQRKEERLEKERQKEEALLNEEERKRRRAERKYIRRSFINKIRSRTISEKGIIQGILSAIIIISSLSYYP